MGTHVMLLEPFPFNELLRNHISGSEESERGCTLSYHWSANQRRAEKNECEELRAANERLNNRLT